MHRGRRSFIGVILGGMILWAMAGNSQAQEEKKKEEPVELGEVVVTATRSETDIAGVPASVEVVTKEQVEKKKPLTVDQSMNDLPGVFDYRGKGLMDTQAAIYLRGMPGGNRSLILLDGIPLNNAYTGDVQWAGIAPEDVEKIEVVKGPFSSLYGGNAMGGVVNIFTRMPEEREFTLKAGYGTAWTRGQAMDDLQKYYLSYGDNVKDKLSLFLSYGWKGTNGYPTALNFQSAAPPAGVTGAIPTTDQYGNPGYYIGDTGDNRWWDDSLNLKAVYSFSKETKLSLSLLRTEYKYVYDAPHTFLTNASGNPVFSYGNGAVPESSFLLGLGYGVQNIYNASFQTEVSGFKGKISLGWAQYDRPWYILPDYTATISGGPGTLSETPGEDYYADLQVVTPQWARQIFTFGGTFRYDWAHTTEHTVTHWNDENSATNLTFESHGTNRTFAAFLQDEIKILENLTAYVGAREDYWQTFDGYVNSVGAPGNPQTFTSRDASSFNPKAALVYKPFEGTTLRASGGQAFRPPTVYELYRTWVYYGITFASNPNLTPEKVWSWDFGVEQKLWKGAKIKATYFENYMSNLIYLTTLSPTFYQSFNVGQARVQGTELGLEQKFENWLEALGLGHRFQSRLRIFGNFTWNDAKVTENDTFPQMVGSRLIYMPEYQYNIGVDCTVGPVSAYLIGRYASKVYGDSQNMDTVSGVFGSYDPYFVADASVSYKIPIPLNTKLARFFGPEGKFLTASFLVNNIFDEQYFYFYKCPGRSWFTELTLHF